MLIVKEVNDKTITLIYIDPKAFSIEVKTDKGLGQIIKYGNTRRR
jgi:hypothetical protein